MDLENMDAHELLPDVLLLAQLRGTPYVGSDLAPGRIEKITCSKVGVCPKAASGCQVPVYNAPQFEAHTL